MLVHLLDATPSPAATPLHDYETINRELALFDPALAERPQIVVLNKMDLPDVRKRGEQSPARSPAGASSCRHQRRHRRGVAELLEAIWRALPPRAGST